LKIAESSSLASSIRREERERDGHVNLANAAFFAGGDLFKFGDFARYDLVEPTTTSGDCADQARATLDPRWTNVIQTVASITSTPWVLQPLSRLSN